MIWLVQNALFGDEFGYDNFIAAIDHYGQKRIPLDYTFWESTIDLKIDGIPPEFVIPFGTKSFVCYGIKNDWNVDWDGTYTYHNLLALGEDFINHDLEVDFLDDLKVPSEGKVFIREDHGFNIIKGTVISAYGWPDWVNGFKYSNERDKELHDWHPIDEHSLFIWAPVKKIFDEYRVWVIGGKVVSSSQYVDSGEIKYTNSDENWEVNSYAQKMADICQGKVIHLDNFVIDIFRTEKGLKVGEINCIHCSGWYAIDSTKVVKALVEYHHG